MGWVKWKSQGDVTPQRRRPGPRRPRRRGTPLRTVPAAALAGSELVHIGGGENLPCPDADLLPLSVDARRMGFGTPRLALPPVRLHVLRDVVVQPGSRVVTTKDGRVVAESVTSAMAGSIHLDRAAMRNPPVRMSGTVAVFRGPLRSTFHTLVDDLPRAGLLIHPVVGRLGPVALLHDGPLDDVESPLLAHLGASTVTLREVDPDRPVLADRVVVPGYVTRTGAGAVPSWFRRWSDGVPLPRIDRSPRRVFLDADDAVPDSPGRRELHEVLADHGVVRLDPVDHLPAERFALLRDAELVVGTSHDELAGCLFSRRAHVIELLDDTELEPGIYYLAASKGLPYDAIPARRDGGRAEAVTPDVDELDRLLSRIG